MVAASRVKMRLKGQGHAVAGMDMQVDMTASVSSCCVRYSLLTTRKRPMQTLSLSTIRQKGRDVRWPRRGTAN